MWASIKLPLVNIVYSSNYNFGENILIPEIKVIKLWQFSVFNMSLTIWNVRD